MSIYIPKSRYNAIKEHWKSIYSLIADKLNLQIRYNIKTKSVDLRNCELTTNPEALTLAADYFKAIALGFKVEVSFLTIFVVCDP